MLKNFLLFFPLKWGVYLIALLSVVESGFLMIMKVRYLEYSGMSQGNLGMKVVFVLVSLLLLLGIGQVKILLFL